ncbi:MAG: hypothetical protein V3U79_00015 [Dehalococcoidia bacterium]
MVAQTKEQFLSLYAEGWTNGDVDKILGVLAPGFQFGDPQKGSISRENFREYFEGFKKEVGQSGETFMDLSGIVAYESGEALVACCTWKTGVDKNIVGNGLIIVGDDGVQREDVVIV